MTTNSDTKRLTLWCNAGFQGAALALLQDNTTDYKLVLAKDAHSGLADADIAFGQPDPEILLSSPRLQWAHITSAGYTRYDREDLREALRQRGAVLTNSSHVYDEPCAQHALAMMLALARELPQAYESQRKDQAWETGPRRINAFLLNRQTVVILGFGAIGRRLAQMLVPLQMRVIAIRRSLPTEPDKDGVEVRGEDALTEVLPLADHVMNILPESPTTRGFVSAERLAQCKQGSIFYNIGRGATVDQEALLAALSDGKLRAAYLDVTEPEPLPSGHPLWKAPNCFITPHSAGGHAGEYERLVQHFLKNLSAFANGTPLDNQII